MSWSLKIALAFDGIAVLVAIYFLLTDYFRPSSSSNGPLFLATLAMCGWIALCWYLNSIGNPMVAAVMAWIPAFPLMCYGFMLVAFMVLKPDFK